MEIKKKIDRWLIDPPREMDEAEFKRINDYVFKYYERHGIRVKFIKS